jgi:putative flippase GtrA
VRGFLRSLVQEFSGPFARSVLTSALATGSDFALANTLAASALPPAAATFMGYVVGGLVAFGLNRGWAFRVHGRPGPQLLRFLGVWLSSAALNVAGVAFLLAALGLRFALAWVMVRGLVFSAWNYPLLRWFVFPRAAAVAETDAPR